MPRSALPATAVTVLLAACACGQSHAPAVIACTNPVQASEAAQIGADQILLHVPNAQVGTPLSFVVPANIASLTIIEQAVTAPASVKISSATSSVTWENMAVPLTVTDPGGRKIYDDNQDFSSMDLCGTPPALRTCLPGEPTPREQLLGYVPAAGAGAGALVIPTTTGGLGLVGSTGLPAGTWSLVVGDLAYECATFDWTPNSCQNGSATSVYDVTVIAKPLVGGSIPSTGSLDVVVYFATTYAGSGSALSAATANAGQDPDLKQMVSTLGGLLANAGITLRSTTYVDLPAEVMAKYSNGVDVAQVDACAPLGQLLKNGQSGKALNVFFVSAITGGGTVTGKTVVALDGAIPGPATVGGTTESGIVASTVNLRANRNLCSNSLNLQCGADSTAYYIAHEAGHFLGLSHPTELYGYRFDALADTLRCPCSACKAATATDSCATSDANASTSSHTMTVSECTKSSTCGGGDNLMFWTLSSSISKGNVTAEQKRVLLANPLLQ